MTGRPTRRPRSIARSVLVLVTFVVLGAVGVALVSTAGERSARNPDPTSASSATTDDVDPTTDPSVQPTPSDPPSEPPPPAEPVRFTILAAGDVLPHTTVQRNAETEGGWDFGPLWEAVTPWVQAADLALCHLEIPVAPAGSAPSGYPLFGAPRELIADLARGGWDGCSTASNHSVDRGWDGLTQTLDLMDEAGLGHVGTARTETEALAPALYVLEREGRQVTVAHLAATFSTNGVPVPDEAPWSVQLIDTQQIVDQAAAARAAGADLVLASIHCCQEYTDAPVAQQVEIAQTLADSGQIDLLIGNHSHVPQPMELLPGGPQGAGMWVAYSMGNYISNQDAACCRPETGTGTLMWASVEVPPDAPARVTGLEWTAVPGDRLGAQRIYAMPDLLQGRLETPLLTLSREELERRQQRVLEVVGPQASERTEPPTPTGAPPVVVTRPR